MVNPKEMQDSGMEVMHMDAIPLGLETEIVGRAVGHAAFHSPTGQPEREAEGIVVTAILDFPLPQAVLDSAEFS